MKNLGTDAFGKELKEPTREAIEAVLNPKPKPQPIQKIIVRGKCDPEQIFGYWSDLIIRKQIERNGLLKPTMAEVASLVYDSFFDNLDIKYGKYTIQREMKEREIYAFTGTLYVPNKGVYIQDDPEIKDEKVFMRAPDLVKKLEASDPSVRFVPFGYKRGEMTPKELGKNKYLIALAGKEGAEKLAEVADKYFNEKPRLGNFRSITNGITGISCVSSSEDPNWLRVNGDNHCLGDGCSFGVCEIK